MCHATDGIDFQSVMSCGKYTEQYDGVLTFLNSGTVACGGLTAAITHDFTMATA